MVMPGTAQVEDRREEVDGARDGCRADDHDADDPQVHAAPLEEGRVRQRWICGPAGLCGAAGDQEPAKN
jgi:hypothetical protein